jgi:hypothetical protein
MNTKWIGPLALLAVLVVGDQIRVNRPGHKYRLTVEIETPAGIKSASNVIAVFPDRGYSRGGRTRIGGDAIFVDLGSGKNLVSLLAHLDKSLDLEGMNYLALRAYGAGRGARVSFKDMSQMSGAVPVTGTLIPVLLTFGDPGNPGSARVVAPDNAEQTLGKGFRLHGMTAEVVPNGWWPIDFGGRLGEPVTRDIEGRLPWLKGTDDGAAIALRAAGLPKVDSGTAKQTFTSK